MTSLSDLPEQGDPADGRQWVLRGQIHGLNADESVVVVPLARAQRAEAEVKRLRDALRGLYGVATTPTQHFNDQPAAQAIAASIRRTIPGFLPNDPGENG